MLSVLSNFPHLICLLKEPYLEGGKQIRFLFGIFSSVINNEYPYNTRVFKKKIDGE